MEIHKKVVVFFYVNQLSFPKLKWSANLNVTEHRYTTAHNPISSLFFSDLLWGPEIDGGLVVSTQLGS